MASRQRPDQQQIADVRARDEEHGDHHRERDAERGEQRPRVVEGGLPQREQLDASTAVRLRIVGFQSLRDRRDLRLRLLGRHPGLEPHESFDPAGAAVLQLVYAAVELRLHRHGHPELERIAHEGSVKSFWRDADNRVRQTGEHLCLPDDRWIAVEAFLPHLVTDYRHRMRIASRVFAGLNTKFHMVSMNTRR